MLTDPETGLTTRDVYAMAVQNRQDILALTERVEALEEQATRLRTTAPREDLKNEHLERALRQHFPWVPALHNAHADLLEALAGPNTQGRKTVPHDIVDKLAKNLGHKVNSKSIQTYIGGPMWDYKKTESWGHVWLPACSEAYARNAIAGMDAVTQFLNQEHEQEQD